MIDFEVFKEYLEIRKTKKYFIRDPERLSLSDKVKLRNLITLYGIQETLRCCHWKEPVAVYCICQLCQKEFPIALSVKELKNHLLKDEAEVCLSCHAKKPKSKEMDLATQHYIESYLGVDKKWNVSPSMRMKLLFGNDFIHWPSVKDHILKMSYHNFLKTPYWRAIAYYKLVQSRFRCQMCGSTKLLQTHHRTYVIHGDEIHNLQDLTVLCKPCHSTHHKVASRARAS